MSTAKLDVSKKERIEHGIQWIQALFSFASATMLQTTATGTYSTRRIAEQKFFLLTLTA